MKRKTKLPVVPVVVGLGAVAVAAVVIAQPNKANPVASVQAGKAAVADPAVTLVAAAERKPLTYYTGGVRNDLFNGPGVAEKPKVTAPVKVTKAPAPEPPPVPVEVKPLADYAYTGTINMSGEMVALIENAKTKEGSYVKQGDEFMGGKVAEISDRSVTIDISGKKEMLAKTDDFKLTPLDKNAAYLNPPVNQPGMPGAPGAVPGAPGGAMAGMPTQPWMSGMSADRIKAMQDRFSQMTPEQRQQMAERFNNRNFNRGGGGNGGGGGGGRRNRGGGGGGGFGGGGFGG